MDYHRHHGRDRREDEEDYPPPPRYNAGDEPPPPPFHGGNEPPPPFYGRNDPPPPFYGRHEPPPPFYGGNDPPPPFYGGNEPPPPFHGRHEPPPPFHGGNEYAPPSQVYHSSHIGPDHESYPPNYSQPPAPPTDENPHHHHRPHMPHFPSTGHGHKDQENEMTEKPSVRMYSKAETNYSLTIRDGRVILARSDPSDPFQHWIKEEKWSTRVKDEEGFPSFALINKATGEALKHATGATHPVQLTPYNPNVLDESVLWTESRDIGDTYRAIRMVNNIRLNIDAFNGDKNHGGVHDGTTIVLWEWKKGDNQWWKIVPY